MVVEGDMVETFNHHLELRKMVQEMVDCRTIIYVVCCPLNVCAGTVGGGFFIGFITGIAIKKYLS